MYLASCGARIGGLRARFLVSMMILAVTLPLSQPVQAEGEAIQASYRCV